MVKACKAAGYNKLILCDINLSAAVQFYKTCKKNEIKPIIGMDLRICELDPSDKGPHNKIYPLSVICKNKTGYKNLLKIISLSNNPDHVLETDYGKIQRVNLDEIKHLTDGLICLLGNENDEYNLADTAQSKQYVFEKYSKTFVELVDQTSENRVKWSDVRYLTEGEREDFLVLQCIQLKCTLKGLERKFEKERPHFIKYLTSDSSLKQYERDENTEKLMSSIEDYDILSKPRVPKFPCPNGLNQKDYLTQLCREGWLKRFPTWESEEKKQLYANRVKKELAVLQKKDFDGYFLIVQDYVNWAKNQGWFVNFGRGSSAGCLVSYLLGITEIDSVKDDIIFERFLQEERASLPDIDTDFPTAKKPLVVKYIENKFGKSRVCPIATYGTLKGAGAVTEVLRIHNVFDSKKIKSITKSIPQQDKVSDKMEFAGETSLITYVLKHVPEVLKELGKWENDKIVGEYSYYLEQAIRLEGCIKSYGIHPSGILISDEDLEETCPLVIENNGESKYCSWEMDDAADAGLVKMDILALESLDIVMDIWDLLEGVSDDQ